MALEYNTILTCRESFPSETVDGEMGIISEHFTDFSFILVQKFNQS